MGSRHPLRDEFVTVRLRSCTAAIYRTVNRCVLLLPADRALTAFTETRPSAIRTILITNRAGLFVFAHALRSRSRFLRRDSPDRNPQSRTSLRPRSR